ncbi:unnamed protein product [Rodentolepis nana]|uniref:Transposase n=1 Tax=Rodentolepis nana TaxID=102285 RepID=A0A0R3TI77_RODNA|nr:unnamed protein product [Rodentolepis nana]
MPDKRGSRPEFDRALDKRPDPEWPTASIRSWQTKLAIVPLIDQSEVEIGLANLSLQCHPMDMWNSTCYQTILLPTS